MWGATEYLLIFFIIFNFSFLFFSFVCFICFIYCKLHLQIQDTLQRRALWCLSLLECPTPKTLSFVILFVGLVSSVYFLPRLLLIFLSLLLTSSCSFSTLIVTEKTVAVTETGDVYIWGVETETFVPRHLEVCIINIKEQHRTINNI